MSLFSDWNKTEITTTNISNYVSTRIMIFEKEIKGEFLNFILSEIPKSALKFMDFNGKNVKVQQTFLCFNKLQTYSSRQRSWCNFLKIPIPWEFSVFEINVSVLVKMTCSNWLWFKIIIFFFFSALCFDVLLLVTENTGKWWKISLYWKIASSLSLALFIATFAWKNYFDQFC